MKSSIYIRISPNFVRDGLVDNKQALLQVKAWCRSRDKPLPEPVMSQYYDVICRRNITRYHNNSAWLSQRRHMSLIAFQITGTSLVCLTSGSGLPQSKQHSSTILALTKGQ